MEFKIQELPPGIELANLIEAEYHMDICHGPVKNGAEQFFARVYRGGVDLETGEAIGALIWVDPDLWPDTLDAAEQAKTWIDQHASARKRRHFLTS